MFFQSYILGSEYFLTRSNGDLKFIFPPSLYVCWNWGKEKGGGLGGSIGSKGSDDSPVGCSGSDGGFNG